MPLRWLGMMTVSTERRQPRWDVLPATLPPKTTRPHWNGPVGPYTQHDPADLAEFTELMAERGWRSDDPTDPKLFADAIDCLQVMRARRRQDAAGEGWRRALPDVRPAAVGGTR